MKTKIKTLGTSELKTLRKEIDKELKLRETQQNICVWSMKEGDKKETPSKTWEGETYIS